MNERIEFLKKHRQEQIKIAVKALKVFKKSEEKISIEDISEKTQISLYYLIIAAKQIKYQYLSKRIISRAKSDKLPPLSARIAEELKKEIWADLTTEELRFVLQVSTQTISKSIELSAYQTRPEDPKESRKLSNSKYDFGLVDWGKKDTEIAEELGCSKQYVYQVRCFLKKQSERRSHVPLSNSKLDWDSVDWSKSNVDIAKELNCSHWAVYKARNIKGKPFIKVKAVPLSKSKFDWKSVDWHKTDREISEELGCSKIRVTQVRKKLGKLKRQLNQLPQESLH